MRDYVYQVLMEPEEDGGFSVHVPDLPGCVTCGDDFLDGIRMAADAIKTFIASLLLDGMVIPEASEHPCPDGWRSAWVSVEADESHIVQGPSVSAAEAARRLGVSRARVSCMLRTGILEGYRELRSTYVTLESIERRLASKPRPGRPARKLAVEGERSAPSGRGGLFPEATA